MTRTNSRRRPGFTLVELLVVIIIIGILLSLLVPVIYNAVRRANEARVRAEIELLGNALAQFRERYGDFPPSRVVLAEGMVYPIFATNYTTSVASYDQYYQNSPTYNSPTVGNLPGYNFGTPDLSIGSLAERSTRYLRKFFPSAKARTANGPAFWHDFNGDNAQAPGVIYLQGPECLVFFLGGIPNPTTTANGGITFNMSGFGKNPSYPFTNSFNAATPNQLLNSTNRNQSFFDFRGDRLIDEDFDGIPGYIDTLGTGSDARFYAYFSSYGSGGYDPNDVNYGAFVDDVDESGTGAAMFNNFHVTFTPYPQNTANPNVVASPSPNPYTTGLSVPGAQVASYFNANGYQIISAGGDRLYGCGGQYSGDATTDKIPANARPAFTGDPTAREKDNITNFAPNRLD